MTVWLMEEEGPVLKVDMDMTIEAVVLVQQEGLVDGSIVLLIVLRLISEHRQDREGTMFQNRQSPSNFAVRPTFAVMLDPSDCYSCQFWRPQSNHQHHDSMHPDLRWQGQE